MLIINLRELNRRPLLPELQKVASYADTNAGAARCCSNGGLRMAPKLHIAQRTFIQQPFMMSEVSELFARQTKDVFQTPGLAPHKELDHALDISPTLTKT